MARAKGSRVRIPLVCRGRSSIEPRLKSELWIRAQIRICDQAMIPVAVLRKGDPAAGAILIKLNGLQQNCRVLTQTTTFEGKRAWMYGTGPESVPETEADAYIQRQAARDPDLWVIEIEDRAGKYQLDGEII